MLLHGFPRSWCLTQLNPTFPKANSSNPTAHLIILQGHEIIVDVLVPGIFLHPSLEFLVIQHFPTVLQDKSVAARGEKVLFLSKKPPNNPYSGVFSVHNSQPGHPGGVAIIMCFNLREF